jgi:exo-beta-1,3-glucanase (GH17 family)
MSETDSISSNHSIESKEKSKLWTHEEVELFHLMLKKYGTDFHILSNFFPKKTKNQLKVLLSLSRTDTNNT